MDQADAILRWSACPCGQHPGIDWKTYRRAVGRAAGEAVGRAIGIAAAKYRSEHPRADALEVAAAILGMDRETLREFNEHYYDQRRSWGELANGPPPKEEKDDAV